MPKPATFLGAFHFCPQVMVVGLAVIPHVGGPVIGTACTVLVCDEVAVNIGNMGVCVGPPDSVALSSATVFAQDMPMARMGDISGHGGAVLVGMPTVIVAD